MNSFVCLIYLLVCLAFWVAAGIGVAQVIRWISARTNGSRYPSITTKNVYFLQPPALQGGGQPVENRQPSAPSYFEVPQPQQWGVADGAGRSPGYFQQPPAIERDQSMVTVTLPADVTAHGANAYLALVLDTAAYGARYVRVRRGEGTAIDAIGRAAQARGLSIRWINLGDFEDGGWVIDRG